MIYRIARLELQNLFSSPVTWFSMLALLVYTMYLVLSPIDNDLINSFLSEDSIISKTEFYTTGIQLGLLPSLNTTLMVLVPLMCIGVFSREKASGSIKLLYTAPVSLLTVVLGKFLALTSVSVITTAIATFGVILLSVIIDNYHWTPAISGLITLFLLSLTYSAITMFFSTLSKYPIIDIISTSAMLGILALVDRFLLDVPVIGDIFYWLAIPAHTNAGLNGWVLSRDILYFVLITTLFIFLTFHSLAQGRRTNIQVKQARLHLLVAFVLVGAIGFFAAKPQNTLYFDFSIGEQYTLDGSTIELLDSLDAPLTINTYANLVNNGALHINANAQKRYQYEVENYSRYLDTVNINFHLYFNLYKNAYIQPDWQGLSDQEIAAKLLEKFETNPELLENIDNLKPTFDLRALSHLHSPIREFIYKDESHLVPTSFYSSNAVVFESDYVNAFNILKEGKKPLLVTRQNGEEYYDWGQYLTAFDTRFSLYWAGFEQVETQLEQLDTIDKSALPELIVIRDPKTPYSTKELANLTNYVASGGNLLIAAEPNNQVLQPVFKLLGVKQKPGLLVSNNQNIIATKVALHPTGWLSSPAANVFNTVSVFEQTHDVGFALTPLWRLQGDEFWYDVKGLNQYELADFEPEQGDEKGPQTAVLSLERSINGKQQKILIMGDAEALNNKPANLVDYDLQPIANDIAAWFTNGKYHHVQAFKPHDDLNFAIDRAQLRWLKVLGWGVLPLLLAAIAGYKWIRRRSV